jgi:iron(III) transport system permease protein
MAEILAAFPMAVLVLVVALTHTDRRLYDAAASMGASALRTFWTVTLPSCRLGIISAASIAFIFSTTDFGAPQVLGLKVGVLATDIYTQVVGLQNFSMGAAIAMILLVPTVLACGVEMAVRRRQSAMLSARSVPLIPARRPLLDWSLFSYCCLIAAAILLVTLTPLFVSLVRNWPYSLSAPAAVLDQTTHRPAGLFTLLHYDFDNIGAATGGGIAAYVDTLIVAAFTVIIGTVIAFLAAYLVEKSRVSALVRSTARVLAMIPLGLPGLVLGLAFSLLFSRSQWGPVPNPLAAIYGTLSILVACNIVHFVGVAFLTASAALKQLDGEFEQVAASMSVPTFRLLATVTIPICLPAILDIAVYYFVSATTTVSAVIFLQSASTPLASISVINLDDAGWTQSAAAMSVLILVGNVIVRVGAEPIMYLCRRMTRRWQAPA